MELAVCSAASILGRGNTHLCLVIWSALKEKQSLTGLGRIERQVQGALSSRDFMPFSVMGKSLSIKKYNLSHLLFLHEKCIIFPRYIHPWLFPSSTPHIFSMEFKYLNQWFRSTLFSLENGVHFPPNSEFQMLCAEMENIAVVKFPSVSRMRVNLSSLLSHLSLNNGQLVVRYA